LNISKLLKNLFRSLMFFAVEDGTGGAADSSEYEQHDDDLMGLLGAHADAVDGDELPALADSGTSDDAVDDAANPHADQQQQQQQPTNEKTYTIKVDGQDRILTESEMIARVQKAEAAEKRFDEAAALRKQLEPQLQHVQAAIQERQQLRQALDIYVPHLTQLLQINQPDPALINTNPQEFMRQNHAYQEALGKLQQAQAAQADLTQRERFEQHRAFEARSAEEQQKLLAALPDWKDQAKAKDESSAIDGYLKESGFNDQERNGIVDHRLVVVARKAMLYDQLMKQQTQTTQRVQKLPPRMEKPGNGAQSGDKRSEAVRSHAKRGTVESGAAAILQFLDD